MDRSATADVAEVIGSLDNLHYHKVQMEDTASATAVMASHDHLHLHLALHNVVVESS